MPAPVERRFRLPVQDVYRRDGTRIAVGTLASGELAARTELLMLPAGVRVNAERLVRWPEGDVARAAAGETIGVVLDGDRFVGRGDTFVLPHEAPVVARDLALETFWLDHDGPSAGERLRLKRGTQDVPVVVDGTPSIYEIDAAREAYSTEAAQHNIVRLRVRATAPVVFDRRDDDPHGARSVLLRGDRVVAIGFTTEAVAASAAPARGDAGAVTLPERERRNHHRAAIVWLTGLSGAGKSTLARGVVRRLFDRGFSVATVDGDQLRWSLNTDLGFTEADRAENVRRSAAVAGVMAEAGHIVLVSVIAPFAAARAAVRETARHPFFEVFVNAPLAVCEERDPKGLYRKARSGEITSFTGIDSPYEVPAGARPRDPHRQRQRRGGRGAADRVHRGPHRPARRRLSRLLDEVLALARRAGDAILAVVAERALATAYKADDSPVTAADLAADRVIAAGLAALDPGTPVVSEEQAHTHDGTLARFWLVDPLDGTREFVRGGDDYTVNIALVEHGVPVLGVVHAPASGISYAARARRAARPRMARAARRRSRSPCDVPPTSWSSWRAARTRTRR